MHTYPDKYSSNVTNSTTNKGVEAKESEIASTRLDADGGDAEWARTGPVPPPVPTSPSPPSSSPRDCPSYLQVVVEKHRRRGGGDDGGRVSRPDLPARLPAAASSPAPAPISCNENKRCGCGAGDETARWQRSAAVLLPRPATAAGDATLATHYPCQNAEEQRAEQAECVELYRFLRVGAARSLGAGGGSAGGVWRASARARRAARAAVGEVGAGARLAVGTPLAGAVLALRWSLQIARDAAAGAVLALSDYALKPALALTFNALLHPLLVFAANVSGGACEAARPLCAALGECARHMSVVLAALRLVEVHTTAPPAATCTCCTQTNVSRRD